MQHKPIVHVVDDDEAVRNALYFLLESEDIEAQAYSSAEDFLAQGPESRSGCLLLDVRMPGMSGLQLLERLKQQKINIPVVFITGHGDIAMAVDAMKAGAIDFIVKPFTNEHVLGSVRSCLNQCASLVDSDSIQRGMKARLALLTKRETEVMELLVRGKKNKEISRILGVSVRTIEFHRARVMEKLDAYSLSDVVRTYLIANDSIKL